MKNSMATSSRWQLCISHAVQFSVILALLSLSLQLVFHSFIMHHSMLYVWINSHWTTISGRRSIERTYKSSLLQHFTRGLLYVLSHPLLTFRPFFRLFSHSSVLLYCSDVVRQTEPVTISVCMSWQVILSAFIRQQTSMWLSGRFEAFAVMTPSRLSCQLGLGLPGRRAHATLELLLYHAASCLVNSNCLINRRDHCVNAEFITLQGRADDSAQLDSSSVKLSRSAASSAM